MKGLKLLFAALAMSTLAHAQSVLFETSVKPTDVPFEKRVDLQTTDNNYEATYYAKEYGNPGNSDFYLTLEPGMVVKSEFVKMLHYSNGASAYIGQIVGSHQGSISFSIYQDKMVGMVELVDGRKYMIEQPLAGLYAISRLRPDAYKQQESAHTDYLEPDIDEPSPELDICSVTDVCTSPSTIDVMVAYTALAESSWGGNANTIANITQAITNLNTSLGLSGISNVTFNLVHTVKVAYTESGNFSTDLSRLGGTTDGYMDSIHLLRNQYGADLVSLVIGSPTSSCGIGYLNTSPAAYSNTAAFNVVLYSCAVGNYTMAHEMGHNMGLRHDWYVDASTTPCAHHHGYTNKSAITLGTASATTQRWRTIMAYNDHCASVGISCTRVNRWSNPLATYYSEPLGRHKDSTQPSDEAYAFNRMACLVAAFKTAPVNCSAPGSLASSGITASSANLSWSAVAGATNYTLEYKDNSSSTWLVASANITTTTYSLTGLANSTTYDWRITANCSGTSSSATQAQFTTLAPPSCNAPTNLNVSNIGTSTATVSWSAVVGANSYTLEYKTSANNVWTTVSNAYTGTSYSFSGLSPATAYDWRVATNCTGLTSAYTQSTFTTQSLPTCATPSGLSTNGITASGATLSWNAVAGALSYTVEYKLSSASVWTVLASATTNTSYSLTGLNAVTAYNWRVMANCSALSSAYASTSFTTLGNVACPGIYDVNTNNSTSGAATIPFNTDIYGNIPANGDVDFYRFVITTGGTLSLSLTNLPLNYNLSLHKSTGQTISTSSNTGTTNELINATLNTGTYFAKVVAKGKNVFSPLCYILKVQLGTAADLNNSFVNEIAVYPNPTTTQIKVFIPNATAAATIAVYDATGKLQHLQQATAELNNIDVSSWASGIYMVKVSGTAHEVKQFKCTKQ